MQVGAADRRSLDSPPWPSNPSGSSATRCSASRATEVVDFDIELRTLVSDLTDTMLARPGAGLAAPQIGVGLRVVHLVRRRRGRPPGQPRPRPVGGEQDGAEGCLSIPELTFDCTRALSVVARGFNMYGEPVTIEGSDLLARAIQHETDHLDGVLFIDRLDTEARKAAMKAIRESDWFGLEQPTVKVTPAPHERARPLRPA